MNQPLTNNTFTFTGGKSSLCGALSSTIVRCQILFLEKANQLIEADRLEEAVKLVETARELEELKRSS